MSFTSTDVNALIWRYLMEAGQRCALCLRFSNNGVLSYCSMPAGFTHSAYTFSNESQVTKTYTEMAQIAPGSLIRFLYKGIQFTEIEANLKEVYNTHHLAYLPSA